MNIRITNILILLFTALSVKAQVYVSVDGDDANPGTEALPLKTPHKAVEIVEPGQTIWIKGGRYVISERIKIPVKQTTADKRIRMWAMPGEEVIIDGSGMHHTTVNEFKMGRCIYLNHLVNYWHFKGLTLCNAEDNGMKIEGSYNIVENCVFHDNNDTGLQIGMYKDFGIEETKELPAGTPQFNPGYQFCRGNVVINCDAYNNCDLRTYNGTDNGGDADGFACKLFPGPGTEFHGCRAWNNSDDNWDLYMVYHPVVINQSWSYKAGYTPDGKAIGNGNGFKLGGGGSSGGAAFAQSVGAHVVTNCVTFDCLHKGFDQNNATEGMYLINCLAWGNEYNYRFPTRFDYGGVYIRNSIGFNPTNKNHEFLSEDKEGAQLPDTDYNSWTLLDGCNPYKEGQKWNGEKLMTKDYTSEFVSLRVEDFMAPRQPDGSLPDNGFARLKDGSIMIDKGIVFADFVPERFLTSEEAAAAGIELPVAPRVTIPYNGCAPDLGAIEYGVPTLATLRLVTANKRQQVYRGSSISPVTYQWGQAATGLTVSGLPETMTTTTDNDAKTMTISGVAAHNATIVVSTVGGENTMSDTVSIEVSDLAPATLTCLTDNVSQEVVYETPISDIRFEMGGGATAFEVSGLSAGLRAVTDGNILTISGVPANSCQYTVTAVGGMQPITISGTIKLVVASRVLTGGWYHFQDSISNLPVDLKDVISMVHGSDASRLSVIDPERTENGSVPSGCTKGAVVMGRSGGGIKWTLADGVIELKVNLHFTGGRTFKVEWQKADGTAGSVTTDKYSKGTYCNWDVLEVAGLDSCEQAVTISLTNSSSSGEVRLYDMYAKVYDHGGSSGISRPMAENKSVALYQTETGLIAQSDEEVRGMALYSANGSLVRSISRSAVCPLSGLPAGLYVAKVVLSGGSSMVEKIIIK